MRALCAACVCVRVCACVCVCVEAARGKRGASQIRGDAASGQPGERPAGGAAHPSRNLEIDPAQHERQLRPIAHLHIDEAHGARSWPTFSLEPFVMCSRRVVILRDLKVAEDSLD